MAKSTPVDLRDAIKSIIRNGRGIGTDDVIRELRSKHKANLADNAKYLEHVALVRVINEAWTSRKAGHVEGQESLFGGARYPERISFVVINDGKPERRRMEFLDATVEEAEAWIATKQVVRKRAASAAETDEVRTLLRRIGPSMKPGQTFREAMNIARKK